MSESDICTELAAMQRRMREQRERELVLARFAASLLQRLSSHIQVVAGRAALLRHAVMLTEFDAITRDADILNTKTREVINELAGLMERLRTVPGVRERVTVRQLMKGCQQRIERELEVHVCVFIDPSPIGQDGMLWLCRKDFEHVLLGVIQALTRCSAPTEPVELEFRVRILEAEMGTNVQSVNVCWRCDSVGEVPSLQRQQEPWFCDGYAHAHLIWCTVYELLKANGATLAVHQGELCLVWPAVRRSRAAH